MHYWLWKVKIFSPTLHFSYTPFPGFSSTLISTPSHWSPHRTPSNGQKSSRAYTWTHSIFTLSWIFYIDPIHPLKAAVPTRQCFTQLKPIEDRKKRWPATGESEWRWISPRAAKKLWDGRWITLSATAITWSSLMSAAKDITSRARCSCGKPPVHVRFFLFNSYFCLFPRKISSTIRSHRCLFVICSFNSSARVFWSRNYEEVWSDAWCRNPRYIKHGCKTETGWIDWLCAMLLLFYDLDLVSSWIWILQS